MLKQSFKVLSILCVFSLLCACNPDNSKNNSDKTKIKETVEIDQATYCFALDLNAAEIKQFCKVGQKVLFTPMQWGNEQYPVRFAAQNCDLRYSVVITNGAVSCIYKPAELKILAVAATKP